MCTSQINIKHHIKFNQKSQTCIRFVFVTTAELQLPECPAANQEIHRPAIHSNIYKVKENKYKRTRKVQCNTRSPSALHPTACHRISFSAFNFGE